MKSIVKDYQAQYNNVIDIYNKDERLRQLLFLMFELSGTKRVTRLLNQPEIHDEIQDIYDRVNKAINQTYKGEEK